MTLYHIFHIFLNWDAKGRLSDDKILALTKLKAFANDKSMWLKKVFSDKIENIVGNGENAG